MADPHDNSRLEEVFERRVRRRGLRPQVAASLVAALWLIAIVGFGVLEHLVDRDSFDTVWQGMWWATQTVTTVGYGDVVPDQGVGQVVASILMIAGLSFFAVVTGVITSGFVSRAQAERRADPSDPVMMKLNEISTELQSVRDELARISRSGPP